MKHLPKLKTAFFVFTILWQPGFAINSSTKTDINLNRDYSFEKNIGQFPNDVLYSVRLQNYSGFLTRTGFVVTWRNSLGSTLNDPVSSGSFGLEFTGEYFGKIIETGRTEYRVNYMCGTDKKDWILNVPHYKKIIYPGLYKGIDTEFHIRNNKVEFDYIISPNTDPSAIGFTINGAENIHLNKTGNIEITIENNQYIIESPKAYQVIDGLKKIILADYILCNNTIKLSLGKYDKNYSLIIDPSAYWATVVGGSGRDYINDVKFNRNTGKIYITGSTQSRDFPLAAEEDIHPSYGNVFITKLSDNNGEPLFTTIISGPAIYFSEGNSIAFDANDNIYVAGRICGYGFQPPEGAYQTETADEDPVPYLGLRFEEQFGDVFVVKLSPDGSEVLSATLLGGSKGDKATALSLNSANEVILTGYTFSGDFPLAGAFDDELEGRREIGGEYYINPDGFVAKFSNDLSTLVFSSYIGGTQQEYLYDVVVDNSDSIYIAGKGYNASTIPFYPKYRIGDVGSGDNYDAIMLSISNEGNFNYLTIIGGSQKDEAYGIALDQAGNIYLTGTTRSNFPVTPGAYQINYAGGSGDVFLSKIKAGGRECIYNTLIGGSEDEVAFDVKVNSKNLVSIVGYTNSPDFPIDLYHDHPQERYSPGYYDKQKDGFVAEFSPDGSRLLYSTYLGGTNDDELKSCDFGDRYNMLIVAGNLSSHDFFDVVSFRREGYDKTPNFLYSGLDGLLAQLAVAISSGSGSGYLPSNDYQISPDELSARICPIKPCKPEEEKTSRICPGGHCTDMARAYLRLLKSATDAWVAYQNKLNYQLNYSEIKENTDSLLVGPIFTNEYKKQLLNCFKKIADSISSFNNPDTLLNALNRAYLQMVFKDYSHQAVDLDSINQVSFTAGIKLNFWEGANNPERIRLNINDGPKQIPKDFVALYPYYSFSFESAEPLTDLIDVQMDIDLFQSGFLPPVRNPRIMEWDGKIFRDITKNYNRRGRILTGRTNMLKTYLILEYVGEKQVSIPPEQNHFVNCKSVWYITIILALILFLILIILIIKKYRQKK
jgi:hypothetical protein